jgi:hypothetical protein
MRGKANELYRKGIAAPRIGSDHRSVKKMEEFLEELD